MMRTQIQSDKTNTVEYRKIKLKVGKFTVVESYISGKLVGQDWSVPGGFSSTHPIAYKPKNLYFQYYDDISFLKSEDCCNYQDFYKQIPKHSLITDWSIFSDFSHILCVHLGMDGCIYRIDQKNPIPLWRHKDYIGGFTNRDYNLKKVVTKLNRKKWIRDIKIVDIPYYNQDHEETKSVEFDYKLPSENHLKIKLSKDFPNHYF